MDWFNTSCVTTYKMGTRRGITTAISGEAKVTSPRDRKCSFESSYPYYNTAIIIIAQTIAMAL